MRRSTPLYVPLLLAAGLVTACASAPPPVPGDALSTAEYAINQASQTIEDDSQSLPLYQAQQKLERARQLIQTTQNPQADYVRARRLAQQATVDARLAQAQSQNEKTQAQLANQRESLQTLRDELERQEGNQ